MTITLSINGVDELTAERKEELKTQFAENTARIIMDYGTEFVETRIEENWFSIEFSLSPDQLPDVLGLKREG